MRVKKVPLQDLELWPDEVICFSAYTDTRNPVQQRRTYVDGEKLKAENAKLRELVRSFLYEHEDYIAEGNYFIGDLDLEHAMHHNQAYFRHEAKKLGIEVTNEQ